MNLIMKKKIYSVNARRLQENKYFYTVKIQTNLEKEKEEEEICFYSCENKDCKLFYQVQKAGDAYEVVERKKNQPILLRDFPLIGSEKFHFPFFLNGFRFNPLETRNGLYLNGDDSNTEAKENRIIIQNAIELSIEFINWLQTKNINKRYLLAYSNIPEAPIIYDKKAIEWFIGQQKIWRKKLLKFEIVNDGIDKFTINELKLPKFRGKYNKEFFGLFQKMNITGGKLTSENEAKYWYEIMEKDPLKEIYQDIYKIDENSWGNITYTFTEEDCFKYISQKKMYFN